MGLVSLCSLAATGAPRQGIGEVTLFGEEEPSIQAPTRSEVPLSRSPSPVTVITARQIRESNARTIPELLRMVAGTNVRWNPMVQTIDIRGFGQNPFTNRVLLLIDGVPYNSWNKGGFPQHPGFDFFVLQNVKRLEVVRGPGSALYGENAFWGVINIVTLSGEDLEGGRVELLGGDLRTRSAGASWGRRLGEGSLLVSARYLESQLPLRFWFDENDSEVRGGDLFVKGKYRGLELSYYRHEDRVDGFVEALEPEFPGVFRSAEKIAQQVDIVALKLAPHGVGAGIELAGDLSYARRVGSHCAACHAAPQDGRFLSSDVDHGFQVIADLRASARPFPGHDMLLGVEARRVDAGDHTEELVHPTAAPRAPVFAYSKLAAYFQDQISLARDRLRLVLGLRFDGASELFGSELSPRAAFAYSLRPDLVFRGGWSRAFRFPTFSEIYQDSWFISVDTGEVAFPLAVFVPNPDLGPESIRTVDLGVESRLSPTLSGKVDLFHSRIDDFIVLDSVLNPPPELATFRFANHPSRATVSGGELELRWAPRETASAFASWSYEKPRGRPPPAASALEPLELVYAPRHKVLAGTYLGPWQGLRIALEGQWRDSYQAPGFWNLLLHEDPATARLAGYLLLDARVSYDLPLRGRAPGEALRFSLRGRNLLDETPFETLVGIDSRVAGRSFYVGMELAF